MTSDIIWDNSKKGFPSNNNIYNLKASSIKLAYCGEPTTIWMGYPVIIYPVRKYFETFDCALQTEARGMINHSNE